MVCFPETSGKKWLQKLLQAVTEAWFNGGLLKKHLV